MRTPGAIFDMAEKFGVKADADGGDDIAGAIFDALHWVLDEEGSDSLLEDYLYGDDDS